MHRILRKKEFYDIVICLSLITAIAALIIFPQESVEAAKDGVTLCSNVIIPSLFPFFVLSTLTVELGLAKKFGRLLEPVMRPLFNVGAGSATAFVLGFIGGYPIGAKTVITLYENGECSKDEAERLLAFCNNSGPAFIFGVVGAGVFSSSRIGLMLYLAHVTASVCIGLLFRGWHSERGSQTHRSEAPASSTDFPKAFTDSVKSAFQSTLNICGFVIFFTVFIKLLFISGIIPALASGIAFVLSPFGFDSVWAERLLTGFIELSSGVWTLKNSGSITSSVAMAAFMLGWAGLSVHCQVLSFLGSSGLSVKTYITGKLLHGLLSAGIIFLLGHFVPFKAPASYMIQQISTLSSMSFTLTLLISLLAAVLVFLLILFAAKNSGKSGRKQL